VSTATGLANDVQRALREIRSTHRRRLREQHPLPLSGEEVQKPKTTADSDSISIDLLNQKCGSTGVSRAQAPPDCPPVGLDGV